MIKKNKTQKTNKITHFSYFKTQNSQIFSQHSLLTNSSHKGITLLALVVTIIVLLILAGITIMFLFGENGIISKAQRAKEATERARFEEELELVNLEARAQKAMKGSLTAEEYFEILKDKGFITDTTVGGENIQEKDEKDENGNTIYEITTDDGYVFEATIDEEGNIKTEYQGKENNLPPKIKGIEVTSKTTSSINVEVTINRLEDGRISYYYKKENEEEYRELKINTTDLTANYTGLEQNEVYNIKVVVENSKGSDELEINEKTGELLTGTITQVGETEWNNGEATIEVETTETGYTIQYQKGTTTGRWEEYEGEITGLKHNDIVYVRLWDGTNGSGETAITILDGINPTVNVSKGTVTTSSIQVSVSSSDAQSGMPSNPTYSYYIKQTSQGSYPTTASYTGTNTSYTFTGLTQNTSYDVRVTVQDNAGNTGTGTSTEISTTTVGGATDGLQTGNITVGTTTWSNNRASITLSTSTSFMIQYKIGTGGTWTPSSYSTSTAGKNVTVTGLSHNSIVYARLIDNAGNTGSEASVTVLDDIAPTAEISLTETSAVIDEEITVTVTLTDTQSGIATTSCKYIYNTTSGNLGTTNALWNTANNFSSNTQPLTLTANTAGTYYLHVLAVDDAGNRTEKISEAITVTIWNSSKVTAVISEDNITVPVPIGFTASTVEGEKSVSTGFVIKQGTDGSATSGVNEFVWVPVEEPSEMFGTDSNGNSLGKLYDFDSGSPQPLNWTETEGVMSWTATSVREDYREPDIVTACDGNDATLDSSYFTSAIGNMTGAAFKEQLQQEFEDMRESVETYGGFYIGRYETGGLSGTAVVQKNNTDINNKNWYEMYQKCKTIVQETEEIKGTTSMIWGCQWDATMKWFLKSDDSSVRTYVTDSTGKGNYSGDLLENGTGSVEEYSVNNIYDMAGNVFDWTLEAHDTINRVSRRRLLLPYRLQRTSF